MNNKSNGITLVALVVTIIVLLILAGVSISMVVGNNGIINQADEATSKTKEAAALEEVMFAWASAEVDYWNEFAQNSSIKKQNYFKPDKLNKYIEGDVDKVINRGNGTVIEYEDANGNKYEIKLDAQGKGNISGKNAGYISVEETEGIGKKITNYKPAGKEDIEWQILYADNTHLYLITRSTVEGENLSNVVNNEEYAAGSSTLRTNSSKYPAAGEWLAMYLGTKYNSTLDNMKATMYMLDSEKWVSYIDEEWSENVKYVIGSPTLEMVYVAISNTSNENYSISVNQYGYNAIDQIDDKDTKNLVWLNGGTFWLATPSNSANAMRHVHDSYLGGSPSGCSISSGFGYRPVVCLEFGDDLFLEKDGENCKLVKK